MKLIARTDRRHDNAKPAGTGADRNDLAARQLFRRSQLRRVVLFLVVLSASGCVSTYVEPVGDADTAKLSFLAFGHPILGYSALLFKREAVDDHPCNNFNNEKMAQIVVGMPLGKTHNPESMPVAAGVPLALRVMFVPAGVLNAPGCTYDVSFVPDKDQAYRVDVAWSSSSCSVDIRSDVKGVWRPILYTADRTHC